MGNNSTVTMFLKKISVTDDNRPGYWDKILSVSSQEEQTESDIESLVRNHKAALKECEARVSEFRNSRIDLQRILRQGYEEREVECKHFNDPVTSKRITLELQTLEVLQITESQTIPFDFDDGYSVVSLDELRLQELIETDPIIWLQKPKPIPFGVDALYAFGSDHDIRLARWTPGALLSYAMFEIIENAQNSINEFEDFDTEEIELEEKAV